MELRIDIPSACKQIQPIVLGIKLLRKESSASTAWHQLIQVLQSKALRVGGGIIEPLSSSFFNQIMSLADWDILISNITISTRIVWPSSQHSLESWPESRIQDP